jgi:hypothetical protein
VPIVKQIVSWTVATLPDDWQRRFHLEKMDLLAKSKSKSIPYVEAKGVFYSRVERRRHL